MDFIFDYISLNTFWTAGLLVHLLLAVALLGALTHQAMSVLTPVRQPPSNFTARFRAVQGAGYATAVCLLWVFTFIVGAWIYTRYRYMVRPPLERLGYMKIVGFFDLKEHAVSLGLAMLPAYWYFWKNAKSPEYDRARKFTTVLLALFCWFAFLFGHILNNTRGFGS